LRFFKRFFYSKKKHEKRYDEKGKGIILHQHGLLKNIASTIKLAYNDHPRDPKFVTIVDRWSFSRGYVIKLCYTMLNYVIKTQIGAPKRWWL
jgi:hypothetical protein